MSPLAIILSSLTGTSLLVALALGIAWRRFGREPHAALWAIGFLASSAGYLAQLVAQIVPAATLAMILIAADCLTVSMALLALGFRRRAGLAAHVPQVLAATVLVATGVTALGMLLGDPRLPRLVTNLIAFACLTLSAIAVRDDTTGTHAPGIATMRMLFAFAGYCALLAGIAIAVAPAGPVSLGVYRYLMLVGVPSGMTAIGLGTLLLLGGDLAERLYRLAEIDPLTGLLNRRGVERAATRLVAQASRGGRPLSVVIADLDRFKAINDGFGHALGDIVLRRFADHAGETVRAGDLVGRLGGEEFVFVLTDTSAGQAAEVMDRMRVGLPGAIDDLSAPIVLTASFGIAGLGDRGDTLEAMIARADEALYRSKDSGRDRISFAQPQHAPAEPRFRAAWLREPGERPSRERGRVA
jgi:diguanylate cyclase (GGDEF)-like protein